MRQTTMFPVKALAAHSVGQGDGAYQKLLNTLSKKELDILWTQPALIERVREIVKLTAVQMVAELQEEYDLIIEQYQSAINTWISTEKLNDAIPNGFVSSHLGWFTGGGDAEFLNWARNFLMQEVRINIWVKHCEDAKVSAKPWLGSGGNYI